MLEIRGIDLSYGAARALTDVAMEVPVGRVTCLLGCNGVGKTTLLRAIAGQLRPSRGSILWKGEEIVKLPAADRARRGIALVPQGREIFPLLTVKENLETGLAAAPRGEKTIPAEIFDLFPVLKQMLGRRGGDLSGGQQQQLAIARALVTRPGLLLLDEPTEGIQPSIIKEIARVILHLRDQGRMALLLVEQYFAFAQELADGFAVMDRGRIVLAGEMAGADEAAIKRHMTV
jgi:urea transport system ATP-binding protein